MEELMVKIEKMDFEKQQLEAEKIELIGKRNSLQKDLVQTQKDLAVVKVMMSTSTRMVCHGLKRRRRGECFRSVMIQTLLSNNGQQLVQGIM